MAGILRRKNEFLDEEVVDLVTKFTFNLMFPAPQIENSVALNSFDNLISLGYWLEAALKF